MKLLSPIEALQELCRATKKWGMLVNIPDITGWDFEKNGQWWEEVEKAAPYLGARLPTQADIYDIGFLLCDSEQEVASYYDQTVGDDGPTKLNPYDGPARVYAITCDPKGQLRNENT